VIDREKLYAELDADERNDRQFRRHWRRRSLKWNDDIAEGDRNAGLFRRRLRDRICDAIDAGETDPEAIEEQVCGSFVAQLLISAAINLLIKLVINRIMKRLGLLPQDCEVADA
jgi:hypothetical protein